MRNLTRMTSRKRLACLTGTIALLAGGAASMGAGSASAAQCAGSATGPFAQNCFMNGTLSITAGTLGVEAPATLAWAETITGLDQHLVDAAPSDTTYTVEDATGTTAGWNVTASATTFIGTALSAHVLPASALSMTGSTTAFAALTAPSAACTAGSTCTPPTEAGITYPVQITTAATTPANFSVYNAAAGTGAGTFLIGGGSTVPAVTAVPVGWWLNVPSNVVADTYTSTITLSIFSGPTGTT